MINQYCCLPLLLFMNFEYTHGGLQKYLYDKCIRLNLLAQVPIQPYTICHS